MDATNRFETKFGIPQVVGCIDRTHIPIKKPVNNSHDYFCYKMKYSINCQAICDEKGLSIDVDLRWPGSVHDARVYNNCEINKKFKGNKFPPFYKEDIPGCTPVPPILLGDPAYPLLQNVMKEYSSAVDNRQINFHNRLRSTRNQIECAFGRLKARWRVLNRSVDVDLDFAITLIYTCFVLHNFCEINNIEIHGDISERLFVPPLSCRIRSIK